MGPLSIVLIALFLFLAWAASRHNDSIGQAKRTAKLEADAAKAARKAAKEAQRLAGPAPVHGRWSIIYRAAYGDERDMATERIVRITEVKPNLRQIVAWCELRREERTFNLDNIQRAAHAETGEIIDLDAWLVEYRRSRRSRQSKH